MSEAKRTALTPNLTKSKRAFTRSTLTKLAGSVTTVTTMLLLCLYGAQQRTKHSARAFSARIAAFQHQGSESRYSRDRFQNDENSPTSWSRTSRTQMPAYPGRRGGPAPRREDFYSIQDVFGDNDGANQQRRPYPPAMDSQKEDDGFGAYDYDITLDLYDQADMKRQEQPTVGNSEPDAGLDDLPFPSANDEDAVVSQSSAAPSMSPTLRLRVEAVLSKRNALSLPDIVVAPHAAPSSSSSSSSSSAAAVQSTSDDATSAQASSDTIWSKALYGPGATTSLAALETEMLTLTQSIYLQNNGNEFNINAPKQVAVVLFGSPGGSTSKGVLEGVAGAGNRMAALILEFRALKNLIGKLSRRQESEAKGTAVRSASTVARTQPRRNAEAAEPLPLHEIVLHTEEADPLLLLDASAYIFRAYYSMPPIHRPDGMPTGAVMGFCKMLNSMLLGQLLDGEQPRLVLCFDAKGKTFRHDFYGQYKGNRPSAPMDLVPQFDLVRQAAKAYGICQIEAKYYEADDVIATLATMAVAEGVDANIMSGDKDLMQLVTDLGATPSVQMIDPMKKDRTTYLQVVEKWEVPPNKLGDVLALAGDVADNIPGVRGIGPKTAAKLINDFGSLDELLDNIDAVPQRGVREKLREHQAEARMSRILVELNRTVPLEVIAGLPDGVNQKVSELRMEPFDPDRILAFYDQMGFKELRRSFEARLSGRKAKRKTSGYSKRPKATIPLPSDYEDVPF